MDLKDKIESSIITRTFNVSGMPEIIFHDVDDYCRTHYGDSRWSMIADLVRVSKDDYKFKLLFDEIQTLKMRVGELEARPQREPVPSGRFKSFGDK